MSISRRVQPTVNSHRSKFRGSGPAGPTFWLAVLLIGLSGYRFSLIGSGHFYTGDEYRYLAAEALVDDFESGAYRTGIGHLFEPYVFGRPGFVLVSVIPAIAQRVVGTLAAIERGTLPYYDAVAAFNTLVTLGITLCLFALARRWTGNGWYALLITTVHSLLVCANVWIRHLVPYYESLLLFLPALLALTSIPQTSTGTIRRVVAGGVLSALGFACYPGYYAFVAINAVVVPAVMRRHRIAAGGLFAASAAAVLAGFEVLARWTDVSYFKNLLDRSQEFARLIKVGLCDEGYVFAWRFLRDVEGAAGVALLILFAGFVAMVVWRPKAALPGSARVAILAAIGCYLAYATQAVLRHRTVFYGRILAMYLPFVACGAGLALMHIRRPKLRVISVCAMLLASGWSFASFARWYGGVEYPADFFFETMARRREVVRYSPNVMWTGLGGRPAPHDHDSVLRVAMVADAYPEGFYSYLASHEVARTSGARFIGVNLKWMRNIPEARDQFEPPEDYEMIAEAVNPLAHPAMAYEERTLSERRRLAERRYMMRIYEKKVPADGDRRAYDGPFNAATNRAKSSRSTVTPPDIPAGPHAPKAG